MYLLESNCPMCGKYHYMVLNNGMDEQYTSYVVYYSSDLIQNRLVSFDKFEREFVKSHFCAECQNKIFGAEYQGNKMFDDDELRMDTMLSFVNTIKAEKISAMEGITSPYADNLTLHEKIVILSSLGLTESFDITEDGEIVKVNN